MMTHMEYTMKYILDVSMALVKNHPDVRKMNQKDKTTFIYDFEGTNSSRPMFYKYSTHECIDIQNVWTKDIRLGLAWKNT